MVMMMIMMVIMVNMMLNSISLHMSKDVISFMEELMSVHVFDITASVTCFVLFLFYFFQIGYGMTSYMTANMSCTRSGVDGNSCSIRDGPKRMQRF